MPFTIDGMNPDVILNPHAIPSRMTVAHILEMLAGKRSCFSGEFSDATPFRGQRVADIEAQLKKFGMHKRGLETLYCGATGRQIKAKIYVGVIYYQRLKHMVTDKVHSRGRGRRNALTGQPNCGRSNGGALRVGEMEKDCFNSHGVPFVIKERMLDSSDAKKVKFCTACKTSLTVGKFNCRLCNERAKIVTMPSATALLIQELHSMAIDVKIDIEDK